MAHSREFSIIKFIGFNNLTNSINGTAYAAMKNDWNTTEIINFGDMLLYNAFKMCIIEPPSIIYQKDVIMELGKCTKADKNWELVGILEYLLELQI